MDEGWDLRSVCNIDSFDPNKDYAGDSAIPIAVVPPSASPTAVLNSTIFHFSTRFSLSRAEITELVREINVLTAAVQLQAGVAPEDLLSIGGVDCDVRRRLRSQLPDVIVSEFVICWKCKTPYPEANSPSNCFDCNERLRNDAGVAVESMATCSVQSLLVTLLQIPEFRRELEREQSLPADQHVLIDSEKYFCDQNHANRLFDFNIEPRAHIV